MQQLMTVAEIAALLQLKPETIREMVRRGQIPAIKVGRVWRFDQDAVRRWIEQQISAHAENISKPGE